MTSELITNRAHQGCLVAKYRKAMHMSRAELALKLGIDISTVYRMEQKSVINNLKRRELLVGILGIPAAALGLEGENTQPPLKTRLEIKQDGMAALENELLTRWDVYRTGGTLRAYRGLDLWLAEATHFAKEARNSAWRGRAGVSLSMSFQLQGSIVTDMLNYEQAHRSFEQAYQIAQEIHDPEMTASALARRGVTFIQQQKPLEAIQYLNGALDLVDGSGLPCLRGYILKALSEAYAMAQDSNQCWKCAGLAERALERRGEVLERSNCYLNTTSVTAQKAVDAVLLHDYERAIALFDKSLKTYNRSFVRGRSRLMAQQAEAYFGLQRIDECTDTALEAFALANSVGSSKTLQRLEKLYRELANSRWKRETGVIQLGSMLTHQ